MMKLKHKCLYCQHTTSRMWNLKRHMQSVHDIKKSNSYAKSDDGIPHYQSKYQPSQEEHQYGKRFKDASTQYLENDINHSTIPLLPKKYLLSTLPFLQNLLLIKCNPIVIEPTNKMTFGKFKQDKLSDIGRVQAL